MAARGGLGMDGRLNPRLPRRALNKALDRRKGILRCIAVLPRGCVPLLKRLGTDIRAQLFIGESQRFALAARGATFPQRRAACRCVLLVATPCRFLPQRFALASRGAALPRRHAARRCVLLVATPCRFLPQRFALAARSAAFPRRHAARRCVLLAATPCRFLPQRFALAARGAAFPRFSRLCIRAAADGSIVFLPPVLLRLRRFGGGLFFAGKTVLQVDLHPLRVGGAGQPAIAVGGVDAQGAAARFQLGFAARVGDFFADGVQLGHVGQLEAHRRAGQGTAAVGDAHGHPARPGIGRGAVDDAETSIFSLHALALGRFAEGAGVHQHGLGSRGGEPARVRLGLRLARAHVVPSAVQPCLHPCVVVVAVGPAGRIHLPRGDARRAQRRRQERGFLAAAATAPAQHGQRPGGTIVRGLIGRVLGAPDVHLQRRLGHAQTRQPRAQRFPDGRVPCLGKLVVDAREEHVIPENPFGNAPSPGRGLPHGHRMARHALQRRVGQRDPILLGQRPAEKIYIFLQILAVHCVAPFAGCLSRRVVL